MNRFNTRFETFIYFVKNKIKSQTNKFLLKKCIELLIQTNDVNII